MTSVSLSTPTPSALGFIQYHLIVKPSQVTLRRWVLNE